MGACLRLLGPVEIDGPDGGLRLGGPKERRLLAVLAVHRGEVVSEDGLVDALWDGSPPRTAGKTLQNYVLRLRHVLECGTGIRIATTPPGYVLHASTTDVSRVETSVELARRSAAAGDHDGAVARFDEALALWRGPTLIEFATLPFARAEAGRLDELRDGLAEDRVAALLDGGRHHEALATCEQLVTAQPLRERRWTQLMLALYRDGRQGEALAAYRRLRAVLTEQLGVEPGPVARRLEASILAHEPGLEPPRRSARVSAGRPSSTPCFGRRAEIGRFLEHLDGAAAGHGVVVFVHGEPGIGKSRLLAEMAAVSTGRGVEVLSGRCLEGTGIRPYGPFSEALDGVLPAAAPSTAGPLAVLVSGGSGAHDGGAPDLRPDELRSRLLDAVARFLSDRAAGRPVLLLLLDDLHWADEGTVALLRHTARATGVSKLLVVGAYRSGEVTAGHPLDDALGAMSSETECRLLRLDGLDQPAVDELLGATAGAPVAADLAAAVGAETGGNPFFAREVVRHLQEDGQLHTDGDGRLRSTLPLSAVPDGVRHVIARRRRRMADDANRLIDAAAGIEGPFPYDAVRVVARLDDTRGLSALDALLEAGLVVPDPAADRYDFTHALIRHAVHGELNPSRRLRLHRDLAESLAAARSRGTRISPSEIATQYHRSAALPGGAAGVEPALEAAGRAAAVGAPDEQATFLQIARDLLPGDDPRRSELCGELALARAWSRQFDEAVAAARAAVDAGAGPALAATVATALASAGSNLHAWQVAADALPAARSDPDDLATWATLTLFDLDRREADDPEHPGIQMDLPGRRTALRVLHESGRLDGRGDLGRYAVAAVHGSRERVPARAADDPTVAAFLLGDYAAAVPLFATAADDAEDRGRLASAIYFRAGQARCQIALGDLPAGVGTLGRVRALVARTPELPLGWQLLHHQGAEDALVMALDDGWDARAEAFAPWMRPSPGQHWGSAAITSIGARIEARRGHRDRAMALLSRPVRALGRAPAWAPNYCRMACEVAETLWLLDRRDHLSVVETALREKGLPSDFRFPMTDARHALARLCALDRRPDEARHWFDRARSVLDDQGARPLRAVVDHDEAEMYRRHGDQARYAAAAAAAGDAFERLGMTGWLRRRREVRPESS